ncbi:hypothetical protein [Phytohabitans kaempferiae]|uniref:Uncharacterized protein n=1 Tax=Phytohabitans kaempferiae TaxID=1620943 RepID=A0ABV6M685_9ACTN
MTGEPTPAAPDGPQPADEAGRLSPGGPWPEAPSDPEWRIRLRQAVEGSARQRTARAEHRRMLTTRRTAGLQARQAARLARVHAPGSEAP